MFVVVFRIGFHPPGLEVVMMPALSKPSTVLSRVDLPSATHHRWARRSNPLAARGRGGIFPVTKFAITRHARIRVPAHH